MNRILILALPLLVLFGAAPAAAQVPLLEKDRQFDFWIGAWTVNLRVKHSDGTWLDDIQAREYSYPILGGKAILELWNETSRSQNIRGYSVRYYRPDLDQWELWLNWPSGKNQSGSDFLRGAFRHGRGEFFSETPRKDSTVLIARYTFSDIAPSSFRWDDAYSIDHEETWKNAWIMEFTRAGAQAPPISAIAAASDAGELCDTPSYRDFERLRGEMNGTVKYRAATDGQWKTSPAKLSSFGILGGCAAISFLEYVREGRRVERFSQSTYNTGLNAYEIGELDSVPGTVYRELLGQKTERGIELLLQDNGPATAPARRSLWTIEPNALHWEEFEKIQDRWVTVLEAAFTRP